MFAQGSVYVLASRVTDPQNLVLVGLPPKDLLDAVAQAWQEAGFDVHECFRRAVSVTNEWTYVSDTGVPVGERIAPKWISERTIPHKLRTLKESLNPQRLAASVIHTLLDLIDRVDFASQRGLPPPPFKTQSGLEIFPEEPWWLTDVQRKEEPDGEKVVAKGDEDGPASSEGTADLEDAPLDDALTEDEDPLSDADESRNAVDARQSRSEVVRKSILQWRDIAGGGQHQLPAEGSHAPSTPLREKRERESPEAGVVSAGKSLSSAPQELFSSMQTCGKRKRESPEADVVTARSSLSSPPQELSSFMQACGNNPDESVPREDQ